MHKFTEKNFLINQNGVKSDSIWKPTYESYNFPVFNIER